MNAFSIPNSTNDISKQESFTCLLWSDSGYLVPNFPHSEVSLCVGEKKHQSMYSTSTSNNKATRPRLRLVGYSHISSTWSYLTCPLICVLLYLIVFMPFSPTSEKHTALWLVGWISADMLKQQHYTVHTIECWTCKKA